MDQIECNYEELTAISQRFSDQNEAVQQTLNRINQQLDVLKGGGWIGANADAYYNGMDGEVIPGYERLIQALEQAAQATNQVAQTFQQAEEEAQGVFPN